MKKILYVNFENNSGKAIKEKVMLVTKFIDENQHNIEVVSDISIQRKYEIEDKVTSLLKDRDYKLTDVVDIVSLVKKDGFIVQSEDMPIEQTGYILVDDNKKLPSINSKKKIAVNNTFLNPDNEDNVVLKKSRFITAHEYGHYILHKGDSSLYAHRDSHERNTLIEMEADYFARSILMPLESFKGFVRAAKEICPNDEQEQLEVLSRFFKVTKNKLIKRLGDLSEIG
jgi:conserved hypothetical phage-related protein